MANDPLKQKASIDQVLKESQKTHERPLDPARDAEDFLGDPSGRTGVTSGDPRQISAEPDEKPEDDSVLPGGIISDPMQVNPTGFTKEQLSDEEYEKNAVAGMSPEKQKIADELASEEDRFTEPHRDEILDVPVDDLDEDFAGSDEPNTVSFSSLQKPDDTDKMNLNDYGEESPFGGTAPNPERLTDVGEGLKEVEGEDPDPDMDNPQSVDRTLADKIDEDENDILNS